MFLVFACVAENTIKIVVSANKKPKQNKNYNCSKLKIGPSMLRNKVGPVFNFENCLFCRRFCFFFESLLFAGRMRCTKTKKTRNLDQFLILKKANIGPAFKFTAYIYMHIYICAVKLKTGPRFGVL